MTQGTCKLTGEHGTFVKSHIIPRAFSDKNLDKLNRIEFGQRPSRRTTSWYDDQLVTSRGEGKLAAYDTLAASELKKFGLCWRYLPVSEKVKRTSFGLEFEFLEAEGADVIGLRLFFLSLLWRAAASRRPEFREIRLDVGSMRKLRRIVNGEVMPHPTDFPMTLVLLTTKGQPQNLTPLRQRMDVPQFASGLPRDVKIFRFFIDGLIIHFGRKSLDAKLYEAWSKRSVGASDTLTLIGRPYEDSSQEHNLNLLQDELQRDWPEAADRIYRSL